MELEKTINHEQIGLIIEKAEKAAGIKIELFIERDPDRSLLDSATSRLLSLVERHGENAGIVVLTFSAHSPQFALVVDKNLKKQAKNLDLGMIKDQIQERFRVDEFILGLEEGIGMIGAQLRSEKENLSGIEERISLS